MSEINLLIVGAIIGVFSSVIGIVVRAWITHKFKLEELKLKAKLEAKQKKKERIGDLVEMKNREQIHEGKIVKTIYGKQNKYKIIKSSGIFGSKFYVQKNSEIITDKFKSLKAAVEWAEKNQE